MRGLSFHTALRLIEFRNLILDFVQHVLIQRNIVHNITWLSWAKFKEGTSVERRRLMYCLPCKRRQGTKTNYKLTGGSRCSLQTINFLWMYYANFTTRGKLLNRCKAFFNAVQYLQTFLLDDWWKFLSFILSNQLFSWPISFKSIIW